MKPLVYLATAYEHGDFIETIVVPMLARRGILPGSSWHLGMRESRKDDIASLPIDRIRDIALLNDCEILGAHAVLMIAQPKCREAWCEVRLAVALEVPVVVVRGGQSLPLTAHREGVEVVETVAEGVDRIAAIVAEREEAAAEIAVAVAL